mmetsp:Transcript_14676/g.30936  ORF Transcript_14676/g.30936 Transcript_14676/m.30936 type:complete len:84 (+) Transcript_14676:287-538(+)
MNLRSNIIRRIENALKDHTWGPPDVYGTFIERQCRSPVFEIVHRWRFDFIANLISNSVICANEVPMIPMPDMIGERCGDGKSK